MHAFDGLHDKLDRMQRQIDNKPATCNDGQGKSKAEVSNRPTTGLDGIKGKSNAEVSNKPTSGDLNQGKSNAEVFVS